MQSIWMRIYCVVWIACVLWLGFLSQWEVTTATGIAKPMGGAMLLISLAGLVGLGCVWLRLRLMRGSAESVSITTTSMSMSTQSYLKMSCGGAPARSMAMTNYSYDDEVLASVQNGVPAVPLVIIDLCAALLAPRLHLQASLKVLNEQGVEVAVYSALDAWTTRAALRSAGMMEWFDHIWHVDALVKMDRSDYAIIEAVGILGTPEDLKVKPLMQSAGIPPAKVPPWLRWLV